MRERIAGQIVDATTRRIFAGVVHVEDGRIAAIEEGGDGGAYLMPGFVDAHVHVESSMLTPAMFAAAASVHGTVATVSDPHEIANVLGDAGIEFMLADAARVPLKFMFGAPACVPATHFETAGATLGVEATRRWLNDPRIGYLSEMMNWPGVLSRDREVMAKIEAAKSAGKPVDGHAPGLRGEQAKRYHEVGISTDHECFTLAEALDKLAAGAKILIREGSAARNLQALWPLVGTHRGRVMLCCDDKHPNDLVHGHINDIAARLIAYGIDVFDVLAAACITPVEHYRLPVGLLRLGDPADFIEVEDLKRFNVRRTWIDGKLVAEGGSSRMTVAPAEPINRFEAKPTTPADIRIAARSSRVRVIVVDDGQIVTRRSVEAVKVIDGAAAADATRDLLKIAVVNRYKPARPAAAFVQGFGLKRGAIAGSVAHDSHNIIAVGADDASLRRAVNAVIERRGGLAVVDGDQTHALALPVAGLMSTQSCGQVAKQYDLLETAARSLGSTLRSPFMTLSFMSLLVIPTLKLSDKGLFDGEKFAFVDLFA
ncbi:MAG: adenine deaminase [Planctomycetes bacterium]|nr:adenine deaminase [Planctomycetota bacterium]